MEKHIMLGLFAAADIKVLKHWRLENQYWPNHEDYYELIIKSPWWLVETEAGLIKIGWRKRVIEIDWSHTGIEHDIKEHNVTNNDHMCHAWSEEDALKYLKGLSKYI